MELTVKHLGDVKFSAETRGHRLICDQPVDNSGTDAGMSPPELLLASLGTCAGFYAAQYLKARALPAQGLTVKVSAEKLLQPARLGKFRIEVQTPHLEPKDVEGVLRAVHRCLIHNTLLNAPEIDTVVEMAVAAKA